MGFDLGVPIVKKKLLGSTDCQKKITIRLLASITFKIVNQSEYALGL